jgi:ligand-binding SRPBCC domain-containing protein
MHLLTSQQFVPAGLDAVFAFFGKPENLARITPPWLGFRILTPPPVSMREGSLIDYQISLGPFPTRWRTMITAYDPPNLFVDEQLSGPYSFWHHTHRFAAKGTGTNITDEIRYVLPFGPVGSLVHTLVVRRQLEGIFAHRREVIAEQFPGKVPVAAHLSLL